MNTVIPQFTPIPGGEIELFKQLGDLKTIFDVGARDDVDYLNLQPEAEHHLFEPVPEFFNILSIRAEESGAKKVFLNNFGLGDADEERGYHNGLQTFVNSWGLPDTGHYDRKLKIKHAGQYIIDSKVGQIDFFKMDTEGYELKILLGLIHHFHIIKYLQYEHWGEHNNKCIKGLLGDDFWTEEVGYRNVLCMNKKLVPEKEYLRLKQYIEDNNLAQAA